MVLLLTALPDLSQACTGAKSSNQMTAADTSKGNFAIGVAAGLGLNDFSKDQPQTGMNTGMTAGVMIKYQVYKQFSLQMELNFLQQGGQLISLRDDTRLGLPLSFETKNVQNSSYKLNSIEIPLLVNYTFNIKQSWQPSVYTGFSYAYTYNVTNNYQKTGDLLPGEDIIATVTDSQNATSSFNNYRFNFIAGANVQLPLGEKFKLLLDFRYLTGLSAASANYSYMNKVGFGSEIRSNSFISKIGIIMPLK